MYFAVGGHPGFCVPLEEGMEFEDYYLEFDEVMPAERVIFSADCFVTGEMKPYELEDGVRQMLRHDLFDEDAIIWGNMSKGISLLSKNGSKGIHVEYPDMSYLGIWHRPKKAAPYVCIEPWSSLPSRKGIVEDLATQPGLLSADAGCEYENRWSIEVINK